MFFLSLAAALILDGLYIGMSPGKPLGRLIFVPIEAEDPSLVFIEMLPPLPILTLSLNILKNINLSHEEITIPIQVTIDDAAAADDLFSVLMGEDVELRRNFIQRNAKDVRFLDI